MAGFLSFVVCLALSAGLGASAYRKSKAGDKRGATRLAAWALVPIGLDLAGLVRMGRKVADAVGHWGLTLVFDPLVWIGMIMLGIAVLMLIAVGVTGSDDDERPADVDSGKKRAVTSAGKKATSTPVGEDPEVEAILRKHGVS